MADRTQVFDRSVRCAVVALVTLAAPGLVRDATAQGAPAPYQDAVLYSVPAASTGYGYQPSGAGGPTQFGEISVLREQFFTPETGPPNVTGFSNEAGWSGLHPGDPTRDGLYSQSIMVRVGPVTNCDAPVEAAFTIVLDPGLTVVGVLGKSGNLSDTDVTWGLAEVGYEASSRGMEGSDQLTIDAVGGKIAVKASLACDQLTDDFRVLIDHGSAFSSGGSITVLADQGVCGATPCNVDVNVGGADGNADPTPGTADLLQVVIPLTSAKGATPTPQPSVDCPIAPGATAVTGQVFSSPGTRVVVTASTLDGTPHLIGETLATAELTFQVSVDESWPLDLLEGWVIRARATDEALLLLPSESSAPETVGDSDCDGFPDGADCAPADPEVNPLAAELCDGKDNDCNGQTDESHPDADADGTADCVDDCLDVDGDGYGAGPACTGADCDDDEAACNADCLDADADLTADCADPCVDLDGDGYGLGPGCAGADCAESTVACNVDCSDTDGDLLPDCLDPCLDADGDGYGSGTGCIGPDCAPTLVECAEDCTDLDEDLIPDCADRCLDPDGDGFGSGPECLGSDCQEGIPSCNLICEDTDGDSTLDCKDGCVDPDGDGYGAGPTCAGPDCDETIQGCNTDCTDTDEDLVPDCDDPCLDADGDGWGEGDGCEGDDCAEGLAECNADCSDSDADGIFDCNDPLLDTDGDLVADALDVCPAVADPDQLDTDDDGAGDACDPDDDGDGDPDVADCAPKDAAVHHGADETCDALGTDENCDGEVNEPGAAGCVSYWEDQDQDGFGVGAPTCLCAPPASSAATQDGDCDDSSPDCSIVCEDFDGDEEPDCKDEDDDDDGDPDASDCAPLNASVGALSLEVCNGVDDDCDGSVDETGADGCSDHWVDQDGDGLGAGEPECLCAGADGYVAKDGDCDDTTPECTLDCVDTDKDELPDCSDEDDDNDGGADITDCAPLDPAVGSGNPEICNGVDDNCDFQIDDEGAAGCVDHWSDEDGDGLGGGAPQCVCEPTDGQVALGGDCDDSVAACTDDCSDADGDGNADCAVPPTPDPGPADDAEGVRGLAGGGGCSAAGGPAAPIGAPLLALSVIALLLALARHRRGLLLSVLVVALGWSEPSSAQRPDANQLVPAGSPHGLLSVHTSRPLDHLHLYAGLVAQYVNDAVVGHTDEGTIRPLKHRAVADLAVALGLWRWLDIGFGLPVHLYQRGQDYPNAGDDGGGSGVGDLRAFVKVPALRNEAFGGFGLSVMVEASFPTATDLFAAGDAGVSVSPGLALDYRHDGGFVLALNAAYSIRESQRIEDLVLDDAIRLGLGLEVPLGVARLSLLGEAAVEIGVGEDGLSRRHIPSEGQLGLRWRPMNGLILTAAAGVGITGGYGAGDLRALLGLGWSPGEPDEAENHVLPAPTPTPAPGRTKPNDKPQKTEPLAALTDARFDAVAAAHPDPDGDGLVAGQDKCPKRAEDADGFEDDDGCPDPDNDRDGVPDERDRCPHKAETINGVEDDDGCPDQGKGKVAVGKKQLRIDEKIYFASGSDRIEDRSHALLNQVALVLKASWWVRKVRIEGHTDDVGDKEMNVDLSERRARQVMAYVVGRGVAEHRLEAKGFGPKHPVKSNRTRKGRAENRRVVFEIREVHRPKESP